MSFKDLKMERVDGELEDKLLKLYPSRKSGYVKIGDKKWFLPYKYVEIGNRIYNFEIFSDDTWIITYPRSGTHMTEELVWLVANNMNFEEALRKPLRERFPFIEVHTITDDHICVSKNLSCISSIQNEKYIDCVKNQLPPRFIMSHLPLDLLPRVVKSTCKIIYVARNPRDVVVSWFNFQKSFESYRYQGTFEQFCDNFINDHTMWNPYWEHVKEAWNLRHRANMMFLFYEDLIKDFPGNIKKIAAFFSKTYSDEQIAKLTEHLRIDNFRKNPMVNQPTSKPNMIQPEMFIRQGTTGGWKKIFTPEIEEKFNKWIADNLKDTDLTFPK